MKPLSLRLKGMYSYQEEAVIDFERLTEGRLFGIFGPVGSGKSTILEAITFALYGRSERLDKAGQNYNMMNLRSNELLIDYTFAHGGEGYRFTVQLKRNSKQFEDVRSPKRVAYQDKNGEWIPLEHADGAEILGLSYENFTKTIIIPQGKFQEFLHLTSGARTQMLKELFDLDRFDLGEPANELLKATKADLERLEGRFEELPVVDTAGVRQKEEEFHAAAKAREELELKLKELREREGEMKKVRDLEGSIVEVREALEEYEQDEPGMKARERELDRYEQAQRAFGELIARLEELKQKMAATEKNLTRFVDSEAKLAGEIEAAELQFRATKAAYERRDEWKAKAAEMQNIAGIRQLEEEVAVLEGRTQKGREVVAAREAECAGKREQEAQTAELLQEKKANAPDRAELTEVRGWFTERDRLQRELEKIKKGCEAAETQLAGLEAERDRRLEGSGGRSPAERIVAQQETLEKARQELESIRVHQRLSDFAAALEPGEPCPLCGAPEHPAPYNAGQASEREVETNALIRTAQEEIGRLHDLEKQLAVLQRALEEAQSRVLTARGDLREAEQRVAAHQEAFRWPDYRSADLATIDREIETARTAEKEIREQEQKLAHLRQDLRKAEAELPKYREGIAGLEQQKAVAEGKKEALLERLSIFAYEQYQGKPIGELKAKEDFFADEFERVTRAYEQEDRELEKRKERRGQLRTEIEVERSRLDKLKEDFAGAEQTATIRLVEHSFVDVGEVSALLARDWNLEEERAQIRAYFTQLEKWRTELASFHKQLAGRSHDPEAHEALLKDLEDGERRSGELSQTVGELRNQWTRMGEQLKKRLELEKQKDALQDRERDLGTLAYLFRGSGFVNYVSTMYLHELCRRANERFRTLTRNRLSLEVREDNTFVVRDMVNDGQIRSVKTLSGGQTFQASLSLALALSDNIQQRHDSRHNLFFLDEGFGTLDRDSLSIVFDTLKELRRENRVVGVISHVEELQQEIDLCLRVRQDEEKGSFIMENG